jgi:hypothetical protein
LRAVASLDDAAMRGGTESVLVPRLHSYPRKGAPSQWPREALGRLNPTATPPGNGGYLRGADGRSRRIADVADHDLGRLNWADLCRSRAMLEGRIGQDTCRPRRLKVTAGSRVPAAKASDNVFVAIYTITLSIR